MNEEKQSLFDKTWICDEESCNTFPKTNGINDRFTFQIWKTTSVLKEFYLTLSQLQNIEKQKLQASTDMWYGEWRGPEVIRFGFWFFSLFLSWDSPNNFFFEKTVKTEEVKVGGSLHPLVIRRFCKQYPKNHDTSCNLAWKMYFSFMLWICLYFQTYRLAFLNLEFHNQN